MIRFKGHLFTKIKLYNGKFSSIQEMEQAYCKYSPNYAYYRTIDYKCSIYDVSYRIHKNCNVLETYCLLTCEEEHIKNILE